MSLPCWEVVRISRGVWEIPFGLQNSEVRTLGTLRTTSFLSEPGVNSEKLVYLKAGFPLAHGSRL